MQSFHDFLIENPTTSFLLEWILAVCLFGCLFVCLSDLNVRPSGLNELKFSGAIPVDHIII